MDIDGLLKISKPNTNSSEDPDWRYLDYVNPFSVAQKLRDWWWPKK